MRSRSRPGGEASDGDGVTDGDGTADGNAAVGDDTADTSTGERRRPLDAAATRGERAKPPYVDELPVVGKVVQLMRHTNEFYEEVGYGYDADVVAYSVNRTDAVMVTHPEYVQQVLVEEDADYRKGKVLSRAFDGLAPNGLVASEGEQWTRDRALVQPAFYRERIETYADAMVDETERTTDAWAEADVVRVDTDLKDLTLRIIARTMFGTDLSGDGAVIRDAAEVILERLQPTNPSSFLPPWVPTPTNRRFLRTMRDLRDVMDDLADERRASDDTGDDLLSMLVDAEYADGSTMDREVLQDHLVTFVFAGHETTALLLTWALWLLANDRDAQSRVHDELDEVLDGDAPTAEAVADAEYLENVVDETTRLRPPAYNMFRETKRDVEIGPYEVPEGTVVTTPQWVVHRDERWFDDPREFDPARWTQETREALPEYAHYPFGGGPRSCIGNRFATLEAKLALATILDRFAVEPVTDEVDVSFSATLQPDRPVELAFTER
ncbi:cytochrome P450 [Halorubellus sp. JP-L1]|uniref:cytochrome P450 n=1 Tax=Halorubellus sp. JP-L1 TaxID=2715753 RepID=UPI00140866AE|nr:cytochrome P450 [Halorubellus sp. JP-L1]NHN40195.1 cytochrome P450 [Halorubellus sp. JP-L1]